MAVHQRRVAVSRAEVITLMAEADRRADERAAELARGEEERRASIDRALQNHGPEVAHRAEERRAASTRRQEERAQAALATSMELAEIALTMAEIEMYDRVLELHRAGGSWARIAAQLDAEKRRQPRGAPWNQGAVARLVRDLVGADAISGVQRRRRRRNRGAERIPGDRRRRIRESTRERQKGLHWETTRLAGSARVWAPTPRSDLPWEFAEYLRWRATTKARATVTSDARAICSLAGYVGLDDFWRRLDADTLSAYQGDLARAVPNPSGRYTYLSPLRGFLRHAAAEGWTARDLSRRVTLPRVPHGEPRPIARHLVATMLAALPTTTRRDAMVRALMYVLFSTGCRISEALSIDRCDLRPDGVIRVQGVKSATGQRTVVLLPEAQRAVDDYLARRSGDCCSALFVSYIDHPKTRRRLTSNTARRYLHDVRRRLLHVPGIAQFTGPHVARHTLATALIEATQDVRLVQEILGHRSLATLRIYTEITDPRKRSVYAAGGAFAQLLHGDQEPEPEPAADVQICESLTHHWGR